jgi:hypothetical protein
MEEEDLMPFPLQVSLVDDCEEYIADKLHRKIVCPENLSPSLVY